MAFVNEAVYVFSTENVRNPDGQTKNHCYETRKIKWQTAKGTT